MKNILVLATFLGLIAIGLTATSSGFYADPAHPGKCVVAPDQIYDPGTHLNVKGCKRIDCAESGYATIDTCGVQVAEPGCTLDEPLNPDADYPECCIRTTICE